MVPEARPEPTENGHVSKGEGWFVLNARDVAVVRRAGALGVLRPRG